jgi:rhodanese-related sulfurtransferase
MPSNTIIFLYNTFKFMSIKSSQILVLEALKNIKTITPAEALKLSNSNECNLIDIREKGELDKTGRIENSNHIPRGMLEFWLDPEGPYFKEGKLDMNKEIVLFCAGGLRSALAAKSLKEMGFENVSHIEGGFAAISQSDFKIV